MAYRTEGTDIIIDGFEKGIAPSPYLGTADIRNCNIISVPGEASVGFKTVASYQTKITNSAYTVTASDDTFAYTGTQPQVGSGVIFTVTTGSAGITAGNIYWVLSSTASTFTVSASISSAGTIGSVVNVTSDGTGTFSTVNLGQIKYFAQLAPGVATWLIDSNGMVWILGGNSISDHWPIPLGNDTTKTGSNGNGLAVWHNYIFAFRNSKIDYWQIGTTSGWTYDWKTLNATTNVSHEALIGQDDEVYWCDGYAVGSLQQVAAGTPFDPTNGTTYTFAASALLIPQNDTANCLAYLGTNLLIGGTYQFIYSWDRVLVNQYDLILLSENNVHKMLTADTNVYIFCGTRGRIYYTNGSQANLYKKISDYVSGLIEPYFVWGGAMFNRNQLYFGFTAISPQSNSVSNTCGGVWAIDLGTQSTFAYGGTPSGALRLVNKLSYDTYAGYLSAIIPFRTSTSISNIVTYDTWSYFAGWWDGTSTFGLDVLGALVNNLATAYSNYEPYIDTEMIPVGTFYDKKTFSQIEWKTSIALGTNEAVRISYRTNLSDSFTVVGTSTGTVSGTLSDGLPVNFEKSQWLQLRVELLGSTSQSLVRLHELRFR